MMDYRQSGWSVSGGGRAKAPTSQRQTARTTMIVGGLFLLGGVLATIITYTMASGGGTYYVFYGAMGVGAINLVMSMYRYLAAPKEQLRPQPQPQAYALPTPSHAVTSSAQPYDAGAASTLLRDKAQPLPAQAAAPVVLPGEYAGMVVDPTEVDRRREQMRAYYAQQSMRAQGRCEVCGRQLATVARWRGALRCPEHD